MPKVPLHRGVLEMESAVPKTTSRQTEESELPPTPSFDTGQDILHRVGIQLAAALHSERIAIMHEMERRHASLLRLLESESTFSYHAHLVPQQQKFTNLGASCSTIMPAEVQNAYGSEDEIKAVKHSSSGIV